MSWLDLPAEALLKRRRQRGQKRRDDALTMPEIRDVQSSRKGREVSEHREERSSAPVRRRLRDSLLIARLSESERAISSSSAFGSTRGIEAARDKRAGDSSETWRVTGERPAPFHRWTSKGGNRVDSLDHSHCRCCSRRSGLLRTALAHVRDPARGSRRRPLVRIEVFEGEPEVTRSRLSNPRSWPCS
jgi:hypothetical protein